MTDTSQFRTVLRGYDPAQVEHTVRELHAAAEAARQEAAELSVHVTKLESAHVQLREVVDARDAEIATMAQAARSAAAPSFADLGDRIGSMLTLADEEAAQIRAKAQEDSDAAKSAASEVCAALTNEAQRYAADTRSKAEADAARLLEDARTKADDILEAAAREASARREEAEAVYERQRAKAAAAAADFETTLATRRDKAAAEFTAQMSQHEASLAAIQERASMLSSDAEAAHADARSEATALLEQARQEAASVVGAAREQAVRIKRDSERELAAATARRDSITAQLTNVRQMLATLGGGTFANPLADLAEPAPASTLVSGSDTEDAGHAADQPEAFDAADLDPGHPEDDALTEAGDSEDLSDDLGVDRERATVG